MQNPHIMAYSDAPVRGSIWRLVFDFQSRLFLLSAIVLFLGVWLTFIEFIGAAGFLDKASRIDIAAHLGVLRADLWAEDAINQAGLLPESGLSRPVPDEVHILKAQQAVRRSLALRPLNSELWLLLAMQPPDLGSNKFDNTAALEMVYLTGQWDLQFFPVRISIVAKSQALNKKIIQDFVEADIQRVVTKSSYLKPILLRVYQESTSDNMAILRKIADAVDTNLLKP